METIRRVGGVLLGYIVMAGLVLAFHVGLPHLVGPDRLAASAAGEPPLLWVVVSLAVSLLAAGVGGVVCRKVAGCGKTVAAFAGLTFLLGAAMAAGPYLGPPTDAAVPPVWVSALLPFVGAIGILVGGKLAARGKV